MTNPMHSKTTCWILQNKNALRGLNLIRNTTIYVVLVMSIYTIHCKDFISKQYCSVATVQPTKTLTLLFYKAEEEKS